MILVCPSCDTRYFAEDSAIGKDGRKVRCVSCGHSWFAKTETEGQAAPEDTGLTREQVERLRQTAAANSASRNGPHAEYRAKEHARRQRNRIRATGIAWAAGFVIFAATVAGSILFRNNVAEAWPRAASLYRMVGLDVNRFGVLLKDVSAKRSFDGTTPVLTVSGVAVNPSKQKRPAPQLRVFLRDDAGKPVKIWTAPIGVAEIGPGASVPFTQRFEAPPVETYRLTVTFAREDGQEGQADDAAAQAVEVKSEGGEHAAPAGEGAASTEHDAKPAADGAAKGYEEPGWAGGDGEGAAAEEPAGAPPSPAPKQEADHH
jgi:predicted Zn finger-like uncharacterized protein